MNSFGKFSVTLLSLLWMAPLGLYAAGWNVETIEPGGGAMFTSLRIDSAGDGHLGYLQSSTHELKYGFWDHRLRRWFTATIDQSSSGFCSLALDSKQHPHLSYLAYATGKIKYIHWDGSTWKNQIVEVGAKEISYYTSIALDQNDYPTISFYEYFNKDGDNSLRLRTVSWNGSYWEARTVDDARGSGKFNAIQPDSAGHLHIAYANVDYGNAGLRYAYWDGTVWKPEVIDGVGGHYIVYSPSLVVDEGNTPHITYSDVQNHLVKYISRTGKIWKSEVVDSIVKVAYPDRNGIALDGQGRPYISYYDEGTGVLKVACKRQDKWATEIVDRGPAGFQSALQIHDGEIWVTYTDGVGLKVAHRKLESEATLILDPASNVLSGEPKAK